MTLSLTAAAAAEPPPQFKIADHCRPRRTAAFATICCTRGRTDDRRQTDGRRMARTDGRWTTDDGGWTDSRTERGGVPGAWSENEGGSGIDSGTASVRSGAGNSPWQRPGGTDAVRRRN